MIDALLGLPAHVRRRLAGALEAGLLAVPYSAASLRSVLGMPNDGEEIVAALLELERLGISGPAAAAWIRTVDEAVSRSPRPDLVWSGPEVPGLHARDTRRVYEELLGSAEHSIWASTYAFFEGPKAFEVLARRMDARPAAARDAAAEHRAQEARHDHGRSARAKICGSLLGNRLARIVQADGFLRPAVARTRPTPVASSTPKPWSPTMRRSLSPRRILQRRRSTGI